MHKQVEVIEPALIDFRPRCPDCQVVTMLRSTILDPREGARSPSSNARIAAGWSGAISEGDNQRKQP